MLHLQSPNSKVFRSNAQQLDELLCNVRASGRL